MGAFFWLHAIRIISRALKIVPIPMVIALVGTLALPPKSREASRRVRSARVTKRVPEFGAEPERQVDGVSPADVQGRLDLIAGREDLADGRAHPGRQFDGEEVLMSERRPDSDESHRVLATAGGEGHGYRPLEPRE